MTELYRPLKGMVNVKKQATTEITAIQEFISTIVFGTSMLTCGFLVG